MMKNTNEMNNIQLNTSSIDLDEMTYELQETRNLLLLLRNSFESIESSINSYQRNKSNSSANLAYVTKENYMGWVSLANVLDDKLATEIARVTNRYEKGAN